MYNDSVCRCKLSGSPCFADCINRAAATECTPANCTYGDQLCRNRFWQQLAFLKQRHALASFNNTRVTVRRSGSKRGNGLFAITTFRARDFILPFDGPRISRASVLVYNTTVDKTNAGYYAMEVDHENYIDTKRCLAGFVNHSCRPNCEAAKFDVLGKVKILLVALKPIMVDEELTFDYGTHIFPENEREPCFCGEAICRKFIAGGMYTTSPILCTIGVVNGEGYAQFMT